MRRAAVPMHTTILNVGYRSTNYWVVSAGSSRLLVDLGFPGTVGTMLAGLTRQGVPMHEVRHGLATHYHIDHAGAAQDLKMRGMRLVVVDLQLAAVPAMARWTKPHDGYTPIALDDNLVTTIADSRRLLAGLGIAGQIVPTPGHSDDSVSLLLDDGSAFTGDLTIPALAEPANAGTVQRSWRRLRELGAARVHPGHGPIFPLSRLELE